MQKFSEKLPAEIISSTGETAYLRAKKTNCPTTKGGKQELRWTIRYVRKITKGELLPNKWSYKEVLVNRNIDFEKACEGIYKKLLKKGLIS